MFIPILLRVIKHLHPPVKSARYGTSDGQPCSLAIIENTDVSLNMSGGHNIALSVPIDRVTPDSTKRAIGGTLPKYMLDVAHTTTGTSASAHFLISISVDSHIWTMKSGSNERTESMSSRILSLACMAKIFPLRCAASANASM